MLCWRGPPLSAGLRTHRRALPRYRTRRRNVINPLSANLRSHRRSMPLRPLRQDNRTPFQSCDSASWSNRGNSFQNVLLLPQHKLAPKRRNVVHARGRLRMRDIGVLSPGEALLGVTTTFFLRRRQPMRLWSPNAVLRRTCSARCSAGRWAGGALRRPARRLPVGALSRFPRRHGKCCVMSSKGHLLVKTKATVLTHDWRRRRRYRGDIA
mmetsp:Transcript_86539/g.242343  ORF Transcript_86539/g.242343 Transcript_86539/m.242343 type:complete len:210 (-) Transcript_86539:401-1030(-)